MNKIVSCGFWLWAAFFGVLTAHDIFTADWQSAWAITSLLFGILFLQLIGATVTAALIAGGIWAWKEKDL